MSENGAFFSPQLSTDFLELPQTLKEKHQLYRHYYNSDPIVGQTIDLHTELPLSKIRLSTPKPRTFPDGYEDAHDYGNYILYFFTEMCERLKLFEKLATILREYWLHGNAIIFAEDSDLPLPDDIGHKIDKSIKSMLSEEGLLVEQEEETLTPYPDKDDRELAHFQKNYKGWDKLIVLPLDQVKVTSFSFTDKLQMELLPDEKERQLVQKARAGDEAAIKMIEDMPAEVLAHLEGTNNIPLGTDPDEGSFAYLMAGRKGPGEAMGQSILDRVLRVLNYKEKLRQAQTQIASRAMTPKRVVWAENIGEEEVDALREQIDLSLVDPDYSIVANYEIHWEEMGSKDRLLDLQTEDERCNKELYAGLGVTESLLSGEALYSGDRLKLEVINIRYLYLREMVQRYVEDCLFKPVARRKGFIEKNKWGGEVVLYPKLSFTRLPLRDSQDTYDALFNLYNKGSVDVGTILEMFNLDAEDIKRRLEDDLFTVNDALFNEGLRGVYQGASQKITEESDVADRIREAMKLKKVEAPAAEEPGRF